MNSYPKSRLANLALLGSVLLAAFLPASTKAQSDPRGQPRTEPPSLVVTGRGEVSAAPDRAIIRVGAIAENTDAAKAQQQVNETMQRALKSLRELKIPENKIKTAGLGLSPVYEQREPQPRAARPPRPQIVGYRAHNTLQVELEDLQRVGQVVDAAVAAGANQVESLSFDLKNDSEPRQAALRLAAQEARTKAEALADAMSLDLTAIREVIEGGVQVMLPRAEMAQARVAFAAEQPTPVQPGEVQIEASVTIRFDIASRRR